MEQISKSGTRKISVLYPQNNDKKNQADNTQEEQIKLRVAAYCRVSSSSEEQIASIKTQIKYYETLLRTNSDYIYAGVYTDEGISGTDIRKRDAFNQMMEDCRAGLIDMVITKSVSRFGRNTLECLNCVRNLKEYGVDVFFEKEGIHTLL